MPLAGRQVSIGLALALCYKVGFRKADLTIAVALMTAESGRYTAAWHDNVDSEGVVVSTDRGLFQVNSYWHRDLSDAEAYCAIPNAAYAFDMSGGKNFGAWAAFTSGAYLKYVPAVMAIKALQIWRNKIAYVDERLACP